MQTAFCPCCEAEQPLLYIQKMETIPYNGRIYAVICHFFRCETCAEEFESSRLPDPLPLLYYMARYMDKLQDKW
jgi:C4-type Zn-finger protein